MRLIGPNRGDENKITPSRFHAPPQLSASVNVLIDPVSTSIRLSLPSAKNPIVPLSGDQNGHEALSVPSNDRVEVESNERTHKRDRPS
jgi:hypothetical protein